jgi:hypothetical protein
VSCRCPVGAAVALRGSSFGGQENPGFPGADQGQSAGRAREQVQGGRGREEGVGGDRIKSIGTRQFRYLFGRLTFREFLNLFQ